MVATSNPRDMKSREKAAGNDLRMLASRVLAEQKGLLR
jgi:hypothetical protein